jgi:hypothetical protein
MTPMSVHHVQIRHLGKGRWSATFKGEPLILSAREPNCAAARALRVLGASNHDHIAFSHAEQPDRVTMRGSVGWFADHTVIENERQGPRWAPYKPFAGKGHLSAPETETAASDEPLTRETPIHHEEARQ